MGDMCIIKVVYHNRPDQLMRAVNFYSRKPKILGMPLNGNTVLYLPEETIRDNQLELEPLVDSGVITITDRKGKPFTFDQDTLHVIPAEAVGDELLSLDELLGDSSPQAVAAEENKVALDADGLIPEAVFGDLKLPDELPPELPLEDAPKLEIVARSVDAGIPPELPDEVRASTENDQFFADLKRYVGSRRRKPRKSRVAG